MTRNETITGPLVLRILELETPRPSTEAPGILISTELGGLCSNRPTVGSLPTRAGHHATLLCITKAPGRFHFKRQKRKTNSSVDAIGLLIDSYPKTKHESSQQDETKTPQTNRRLLLKLFNFSSTA